jgi:Reverse transcriptase (RNA-dependent DNA polymerase)
MLSIIIYALERRNVATADVVGAYLKAYMKDFVLMKFTGASVDILCAMNPGHLKFVVVEKGVKTLYVRLDSAIYGCVTSALLWYNLFTNTLKEIGFVLNPYDPCIANCDIEGSQCTIAWYVDDNKISHANLDVVTMIIGKIEEPFDKMTVTRGREHIFLGMHITYTDQGTAEISMKEYLKEAILESGMDIKQTAATPVGKDMFVVDELAKPLGTDDADRFHRVVAKLAIVRFHTGPHGHPPGKWFPEHKSIEEHW